MEDPDDREKYERNNGDQLGVSANDVSERLKLLLEWGWVCLDLKGVFVRIKLLTDLLLLESVFTNCENNSLTCSSHDN